MSSLSASRYLCSLKYGCIRRDPHWGCYSMSLQSTFCARQRICWIRSLELFFSRVLQGYETDAFLWCAHSITFDAGSLSVWCLYVEPVAREATFPRLQPHSDMMRWQENHKEGGFIRFWESGSNEWSWILYQRQMWLRSTIWLHDFLWLLSGYALCIHIK